MYSNFQVKGDYRLRITASVCCDAEGVKDSVVGTVKDAWGSLTGDSTTQAEGKAQSTKGGTFSLASDPYWI